MSEAIREMAERAGLTVHRNGYKPTDATEMIPPAPEVDDSLANRIRFKWPDQKIAVQADRIRETSDGLTCWLTVWVTGIGEIYGPVVSNVLLPTFDERLSKRLGERHTADWSGVLQHVRRRLVSGVSESQEGLIDMTTYQPAEAAPWLAYPYVKARQNNLVFGDGGNGKSTLGTAISLSVASGKPLIPVLRIPERVNVGYWDWETDENEFAARRDALLIAGGLDLPAGSIVYRHLTSPLETQIDRLQRDVVEHDLRFVVIDSLLKAVADDANGHTAARGFFQALDSLKVSALIFTHISNDSVRQKGSNIRPYGGVLWWDLCRNNWFIKRSADYVEGELRVGLYHSKINLGRLLKPISYRIEIMDTDDGIPTFIKYHAAEVEEDETLAQGATLIDRIVFTLRQNHHVGAMAVEDIAEIIDHEPEKVRALLNKKKGTMFTHIPFSNKWGLAQSSA